MVHKNAAAAIAALTAGAGLLSAGAAHADASSLPAGQHILGAPAQVGDSTWTVANLKPSSDTISYRPAGTLWEATATDEASRGSTTPIVSNFNARAKSGQTYRELFGVATAQGVNPAGIGQGQTVSGKLYFDVTGDAPDSITYNAGGPDLALWVQPPPPTSSSGSGSHATTTPIGSSATGTAPAAQPSAQPAARPGGSAGTVIPGAAQGTPAPATAPGAQPPAATTPAPAEGTPVPGQPVPANSPASPAPAPASPAPAPATNPGPPQESPSPGAPGPTATPAPAGSQGTPLQPGAEPSPPNTQPATAPAANSQPAPAPLPPG